MLHFYLFFRNPLLNPICTLPDVQKPAWQVTHSFQNAVPWDESCVSWTVCKQNAASGGKNRRLIWHCLARKTSPEELNEGVESYGVNCESQNGTVLKELPGRRIKKCACFGDKTTTWSCDKKEEEETKSKVIFQHDRKAKTIDSVESLVESLSLSRDSRNANHGFFREGNNYARSRCRHSNDNRSFMDCGGPNRGCRTNVWQMLGPN